MHAAFYSFDAGFALATAIAPGNMYGGISAFGNTAVTAPFGYGIGLARLAYSAAGLAGAYPAAGFAGVYPAAGYGAGLAPYGGAGEGNVAVFGELPVAGTTTVAGQVPIMGAVSFGGNVAAADAVTIFGKCACGCSNAYMY